MKLIRQILWIVSVALILTGCEAKMIRKECRKSSYETCLEQYRDESKRGQMTKAEFKTCWRLKYADCCRDKGVEPW